MAEPKYLPPLDEDLALQFAALNDDLQEWFSERAAIREFMAEGVSRQEAERAAWDDLKRHLSRADEVERQKGRR